jgi:hypothetical protein
MRISDPGAPGSSGREDRSRLTPEAAAYALVGDAVDAMQAADRALNHAYAERARAIDTVRLLSEDAVRRFRPEDVAGWDVETVIARQVRSEVAAALKVAEPTAGNLIAHASSLVHHLPATLTALDTGDISYRHASTLVEEAWTLPSEAWDEFENALLPEAETMSPSQFARKARKVREKTHPESIAVRRAKSLADRHLELTTAADGMAYLTLYLAAEDGIAIHRRITDLARSQQGREEERNLTQLRVDTATHLLTCGEVPIDASTDADFPSGNPDSNRTIPAPQGGMGRGIRATVFVTVPVLTLLGHSDEPAQLDGYGPIDHQAALRLVGTAPNMIRLLTHPETGTVLSVGRTRYVIPGDLRTWIQLRDGTCRASGCSNPAVDCEIDHSIEWQHGGSTDATNLTCLCPAHHRLKSNTAWTPEQNDAGDVTWTAPSGKKYVTRPATRIAPVSTPPDQTTPPAPSPQPTPDAPEPPSGSLNAAPERDSHARPDTGPSTSSGSGSGSGTSTGTGTGAGAGNSTGPSPRPGRESSPDDALPF